MGMDCLDNRTQIVFLNVAIIGQLCVWRHKLYKVYFQALTEQESLDL
jgi:hypothetical protein